MWNDIDTEMMRFLIMGAGALGSALGGFLSKARHAVTFVGRAPHMTAVREQGLRITGIWGDHVVKSIDARTDTAGLERGAFDVIVITTKSYDTANAVAAIEHLVAADTLVCSYQNGLGNAETIAETVGWPRTVGARAIYGVRLAEPGCAEVTVIAEPTALGVYDADAPADRVRAIAALMNDAGVPTVYTDRIATVLWAKVAYNCALNPLSALLDVPYGALLETDHARAVMREVITELYDVGHAMKIPLAPPTAETYIRLLYEELIPPTAAHYASMREDLRLGRRTEIDALNGAICRYGSEHDVPCPTNAFLTRLIHAREHAFGITY